MKPLALAAPVVAVVCAIAAAALFYTGRERMELMRAEADGLRQAVAAKQAEVEAASGDLAATEETLRMEREALATAHREKEAARSEMLTARQELTRVRQDLDRVRNEIAVLKDEATGLRLELVESERRLTEATGTAELNRLRERITELEAEVARLRTSPHPSL